MILRGARRLGRRPLIVLLLAAALTALSVHITRKLSFTSDLKQLLPDDHAALVTLRKILGKRGGETPFMLLMSRNYLFAVDRQGVAHVHDATLWRRYKLGASLHAISGVSPDEAYAVGEGGFVARWRVIDAGRGAKVRGKWTRHQSGSKATLRAVWAAGSGRVLAAGDGGEIVALREGKWRGVSSGVQTTLRALSGVADKKLVVAVGDGGVVLRSEDGGATFARDAAPTKATLRGVWVDRSGDVHVVGDGVWLLRRAGAKGWQTLFSDERVRLRSVSGSSHKDVYAVGEKAGGSFALHYEGKKAKREDAHTKHPLYSVYLIDFDKVWAAGARCTIRRRLPDRPSLWFHGPFESKPHVQRLLPEIWKRKKKCKSDFTAIWRPPNRMAAAKIALAEIAARLANEKLVSRVQLTKPVKFFEQRALYFLGVKELDELATTIKKRLDKETVKKTGLYVDLDDDDDDSGGAAGSGTGTGRGTGASASASADEGPLKKLYAKYGHLATQRGRSPHYVHPDGASVGLLVFSRPGAGLTEVSQLRAVIHRVAREVDYRKYDRLLQHDVGGDGENKIREYSTTIGDVTGLVWLAIGGIVLLLVIYFRRLVGLIFVVVPLGMSIAWTFALTTLAIGKLNVITGFLFAVLFGLGIDFGLQLYGRYREARRLGESEDEAMRRMVEETGRATMTSALTSSVALLSLVITEFRGFSEFGFIAGVGILLSLASFLLVLPALITLAERMRLLRIKPLPAEKRDVEDARPTLPTRFAKPILVVSGLLMVAGIYAATQVQFEYDHSVLRPDRGHDNIRYRANYMLGTSFTPTQFLATSRAGLIAGLEAIKRRSRARGDRTTVKGTLSILDLVPPRQHEKHVILQRLSKVLASKRWRLVSDARKKQLHLSQLRTAAKAKPFGVAQLPELTRRSFRGPGFGGNWVGFVTYQANMSDTRDARRLRDEVGRFRGSAYVEVAALLPPGAKAFVERKRVEVRCAEAGRAACVQVLIRRMSALKRKGKPAFAWVLRGDEAVKRGEAVEGGLRGDVVALAAEGFVPRVSGAPSGAGAAVAAGEIYEVSSGEMVMTEVVEVMLRDSKWAFGLALAAVFIACLIDFRSLRLALLACLPLLVGLSWIFLALMLLSLKLNMFNFVVLPVLVGVGIDYGVHFVHRYHLEGAARLDWVARQLRWVLLFCSCTTIVGFGNMALAAHPGLRSLGVLSVIGLIAMFVASTVSLPALLRQLDRGRR